MKYQLNFKSDNYGKKTINEPFNMYETTFNLNQKTDGGKMGRDVSFSGGDALFEFTDQRDHQLKKLLYYHRKFGFEAKVVLSIEVDADNIYYCDLDFATAETDGLTYFNAKGIEDSSLQIIKARKSVKVDLFSSVNVDGDYIEPLVGENMLLLAKPIIQKSEYTQVEKSDGNRKFATEYINPCLNLFKSDIKDSYTFFEKESNNPFNFKLITATTNLRSVNVSLKDISILIPTYNGSGAGSNFTVSLIVSVRNQETLSVPAIFSNVLINESRQDTVGFQYQSNSLNVIIPEVLRGNSIYIYFRLDFNGSTNNPFYHSIGLGNTEITAESTAYNSIAKSFRLIDIIRQVIKSTSGIDINAPRFDVNGEFYDNRLLSGNLLRGIETNGFKVSLEDIENSLDEIKGDYEIGSDGKVFFGIETDFYTSTESGFFNNIQFKEMNKTFNPKYTVNEFKYAYKNYQSLKEAQELNSADTIHGESIHTLFNKNVENTKEVKIEWTRDAFLIEATRALALVYNESTASQDDDEIFAIDSIPTTFNSSFTEVTELQHTYDSANNRLVLRNNGSVNFISLGIIEDSIFIINPIDLNAGTYRVFSVSNNSLELTRLLNTNTSAGDGVRSTNYTYQITKEFTPFTNYTNQGFTETTNLNAANSYSNRRYSIIRNIYNYWQSYLKTCNIYWSDRPLKNTYYKNNGDYTAKFNGVKLTENQDFYPENPILSPILYNDIIFANVDFEDFITLQSRIRSERGFIRSIDNNNQVIKVYPIDMEYSLAKKELKIKAEEKYEPINMTISTKFDYILVNNETRLDTLRWEIENDMLYLYDTNRYRLYNGVYWFETSVNNAIPDSINKLKEWLSLIK